jgi:hypothetical protein
MHNASTLMMGTTALVAVATQETELHVTISMSVPLGVQSVMRMQSVLTQQAAISAPASLATLVMDIHVKTLMSVLPILVMRMQLVPIAMGASHVSATVDLWEMEHLALVGS